MPVHAAASPLVPLLAVGALTAVGALLISKKASAAPALPAFSPTAAPPAPAVMPSTETGPAPEPEPEPAPAPDSGGSSDGGGSSGGGSSGGSSGGGASAPAASGPSYTNPLATAAASGATAPTVSALSSRFVLPKGPAAPVYQAATMADRQVAASRLSVSTAKPMVYGAPTLRRTVPHGDISGNFGGDVQTYAKENAPTMALIAGSGGILGWMLGKSVASAVLGAALAPVVIALGVTKLIDKKVG